MATTFNSEMATFPAANLNDGTLSSVDGTLTDSTVYVSGSSKPSGAYHYVSFQLMVGGATGVGSVAVFMGADHTDGAIGCQSDLTPSV